MTHKNFLINSLNEILISSEDRLKIENHADYYVLT